MHPCFAFLRSETDPEKQLLSDIVKRRSIRRSLVVMSHAAIHIQALFNRAPSGRSRNKLVFLSVSNSNF